MKASARKLKQNIPTTRKQEKVSIDSFSKMSEQRATQCGLFGIRPEWCQRFVTQKWYMAVFVLVGTLQGTIFSYLTVVLSTIEKQFGLKSKEAAWIYSGNEISQIAFVVFLPFLGRLRRKPLWIGLASVLAAVGIYIIALPHVAGRGASFIKGTAVLAFLQDQNKSLQMQ